MRIRRLHNLTVALTGLLALVTGCSEHSGMNAQCNETVLAGIFEREVAPATQSCASCHGGSRPPPFAVPDTLMAFRAAYPMLVGTGESRLVTQAGNNHCGNPELCGDNAAMRAAVEAFRAGAQGGCNGNEPRGANRFRSNDASLAQITEATNNPNRFVKLTLNAPAPFTGSFLYAEVVLQPRVDGSGPEDNLCRIRSLKFVPAVHSSLKGVAIYVNGTWSSEATNYMNIDLVFKAQPLTSGPGDPRLTNLSQTFHCGDLEDATLGVSVELKTSEPPSGGRDIGLPEMTPLVFFGNYVAPILQRQCAGCHNSTHPTFKYQIGNIEQRRLAALTKVNLTAPTDSSPLVAKPLNLNGTTHGGGLIAITAADRALINQWIEREKAAANP